MGKLLWSAAMALAGAVASAMSVAFFHDPLYLDVIPWVMAYFHHEQTLQLFDVDDQTTAESTYSIYISSSGPDVAGRIVVHDQHNDPDFDKQSYVLGSRGHDILTFTYTPIHSERLGGGAFFGQYDSGSGSYVGSLVGFSHSAQDGRCSIYEFLAVLGPTNHVAQFSGLAKQFADMRQPRLFSSKMASLKVAGLCR